MRLFSEKKPSAGEDRERPLSALIVILFLIMGICSYRITEKILDYRTGRQVYEEYAETYTLPAESADPDPQEPEADGQPEEPVPSRVLPADAVEDDGSFPIRVNFTDLKAENPDVVGWLYLEGSRIHYPVVKGKDNDQYLHTLINGRSSYGGTLFLDASCRGDWTSRNSIIYGHNMNDGSMFHDLSAYKSQEYADAHPYLYLSAPDGNYRLDVFAGIVTESEAEVYSTVFTGDESFSVWLEEMQSRSRIRTEVHPGPDSRIVSMSTCTYEREDMRFVVMAVLRPIIGRGTEHP